ncbi:hypothetical protein [Mesobacillus subterraneus]|uniref:SH3b domain-containing protein n=1 Tax=Mesobacillus subterraneus TaxID=285983 RepID=A0A3R9FFP9_9BACI|nr:hypothetical protein [Mesobacillus subterraneus]RSD26981.1 hypothetical protein EJA10_10555 [Mesobacillus subterraneus]
MKTKKKTIIYHDSTGELQKAGSLEKRQSFKVIANKGTWYQVQFGKKKGYVKKSDVTAYSIAPSKGFTNNKGKSQGIITIKRSTSFVTTPYSNGEKVATIFKGAETSIYSTEGTYYKVIFGGRIGYILKSAAQLEYSNEIKYIQVTEPDAALYSIKDHRYIKIGTVDKDRVFLRGNGNSKYNELLLGSEKVYIAKNDAKPLLSTKISNFIVESKSNGINILTQSTVVYLQPDETSATAGTLLEGQHYNYISKSGDWYEINFMGRKGYILDSNLN